MEYNSRGGSGVEGDAGNLDACVALVKEKRLPRQTFLPFALPHITQAEIDEVVDTLRSGWLTTGPKTKRFEREFAMRVEAPFALAVNSATAAMHLALDAIGLQAGDEVIVPDYTFTATAEVVAYFKAKPVFVDVDLVTCNLDAAQLEKHITPRTRAIMVVHIAGLPAELDAIHAIAKAYGLPVIEDAAHAFPAKYRGQMIGTTSDLTAFSFYATKTLCTGEGGMLTTANAEYAQRAAMMSLHGISRDAWKRYSAEGSWFYEVIQAGYKYNMTEACSNWCAASGFGNAGGPLHCATRRPSHNGLRSKRRRTRPM